MPVNRGSSKLPVILAKVDPTPSHRLKRAAHTYMQTLSQIHKTPFPKKIERPIGRSKKEKEKTGKVR